MKKLKEEIEYLISLKQEGGYWDFKREWYDTSSRGKQEMLYDIICMANNLENKDAYIIIGIDEEKDYTIFDITKNPRRNTQNIVNFLKDKKFAADQRPKVSVQKIELSEGYVDVIVIHNSNNTPFYLQERYLEVSPNNIYIRTQDSNTPKEKSADFVHIEYLWKKRFGMLMSPLEKFQLYLEEPNNWIQSSSKDDTYYYKFAPEYIIVNKLINGLSGYEYYTFNQIDKTPFWYNIFLKYHQTVIEESGGVALDGGRYYTNTPLFATISLDKFNLRKIYYRYFIKNTLEWNLHNFFYNKNDNEQINSHDRFVECILIFESEYEKYEFKDYVFFHWYEREKYVKDIILPNFNEAKDNKEYYQERYLNVQILRKMLKKFRLL